MASESDHDGIRAGALPGSGIVRPRQRGTTERLKALCLVAALVVCLGHAARTSFAQEDNAKHGGQEAPSHRLQSLRHRMDRVAEEILPALEATARRPFDLKDQRNKVQGAEATYKNATLSREVAELAVVEYRDDAYKEELKTIEFGIDLAKKNIKKWEDAFERTRRIREEILDTPKTSRAEVLAEFLINRSLHGDELMIERSKLEVEQGETKRDVLVKYDGPKRIKELQSEVEKARADEKAKEALWGLEKQKQTLLEREAAKDPLASLQKPVFEALKQAFVLDDELAGRMDQLKQGKAEDQAKVGQLLDQLAAKLQDVEASFEPWRAKKEEIAHKYLRYRVRKTEDSLFMRMSRVLPPAPPL